MARAGGREPVKQKGFVPPCHICRQDLHRGSQGAGSADRSNGTLWKAVDGCFAIGTGSTAVIIAFTLLLSGGLVIFVERPLDRWRHRVTESRKPTVLTGEAAE